jgi:hypothetical protein
MGFIPGWAIGGVVIIFASALAKILLAKTRASSPTLPPPGGETGELRQAIDAMQNRLGELEERVDFTERLLAKQREADRLAPPST